MRFPRILCTDIRLIRVQEIDNGRKIRELLSRFGRFRREQSISCTDRGDRFNVALIACTKRENFIANLNRRLEDPEFRFRVQGTRTEYLFTRRWKRSNGKILKQLIRGEFFSLKTDGKRDVIHDCYYRRPLAADQLRSSKIRSITITRVETAQSLLECLRFPGRVRAKFEHFAFPSFSAGDRSLSPPR